MRTQHLPDSPVRLPAAARAAMGGLWHQIGVLSAAAMVYFGVRIIVQGSTSRSTRNAERLLDVERWLGIDVEVSIQQFATDHDAIRLLGNLSYVWLHWPLLLGVLWYLFRSCPSRYIQLRNALFLSGAIGLVLFAFIPMAPPRFMPGFVGTVSDEARRHYVGYPLSWSNKYAAFPSFHVGWTLIACLAISSTVRHRWSHYVALVPALLVGVAVVTTGNHYLLDSFTGAALALGAYWYFSSNTDVVQEPTS
jgi:hypothetical protein